MKLSEFQQLVEGATPGPWFYNSYSGVFSAPLMEQCKALEDECAAAGWPPCDLPQDQPWYDRFYDTEPQVCKVPAHHGDTATGRHAANAAFIAACRDMVPKLLEVARAAQVGAFHHNCCPWLEGKECCCAKQLVDSALAAMEADE